MGIIKAIQRTVAPKCPHCGESIGLWNKMTKDFCPKCSGKFSRIQCPVCHATSIVDPKRPFCPQCGAQKPDVGPIRALTRYLRRGDAILAYRDTMIATTPPLTSGRERVHGVLVVESGSHAAILLDGRLKRLVEPGRYDLTNLTGESIVDDRLQIMVFDGGVFVIPSPNMLQMRTDGLPQEAAAVMLPEVVQIAAKEGDPSLKASRAFSFSNLPDRDGIPVTMNIILWLRLGDPERFFHNVFKAVAASAQPPADDKAAAGKKGKQPAEDVVPGWLEQFTYEDAAAFIFPFVHQWLADQVRQRTYEDLCQPAHRAAIEAALAEGLGRVVTEDGLELVRVALLNVANKDYDELRTEAGQQQVELIRRNRAVQAMRDEAAILGARVEVRKQILEQVVSGELSLEAAEKRLASEQAVLLDRLESEGRLGLHRNELNEQDGRERALLDLYKSQLAREDEMRPLLESREDAAIARQQFLALLTLQNDQELALLDVAQKGALALATGDQELKLIDQNVRRQRALVDVLRVQGEQKLLAAKSDVEVERVRSEFEREETQHWMTIRERSEKFEAEMEIFERNAMLDAHLRRLAEEAKVEIGRKMAEGQIRREELEALKGMSQQQALAWMSERTPALAQVMIAQAQAQAGSAHQEQIAQLHQSHAEDMRDTFNNVMQMLGTVVGQALGAATGIAHAQKADVLVTGNPASPYEWSRPGVPMAAIPAHASGGNGVSTDSAKPGQTCPKCGRPILEGQPNCGWCKADLRGNGVAQ